MEEPLGVGRLRVPHTTRIRAIRGPADLAVLIDNDVEGFSLSIWDGTTRLLQKIPFEQVTFATTITPDGSYILDLIDPTGSELGHLHATPISSGPSVDVTPGFGSYTVRGIDCSLDSQKILVTAGDDSGFFAVLTSVADPDKAQVIFRSKNEAWSGMLSADCTMSALETTDHNPGVRRFAVTVIDNLNGKVISTLSDGSLGPVRPIRFAQQPGDNRILASSEVSGFARPLIWNPETGERIDISLPSHSGDVVALDWHSETGRILMVHVDEGIHRLLEHDLKSGRTSILQHLWGSFFEPDTGSESPMIWSSYYANNGKCRIVTRRWEVPLHILEIGD